MEVVQPRHAGGQAPSVLMQEGGSRAPQKWGFLHIFLGSGGMACSWDPLKDILTPFTAVGHWWPRSPRFPYGRVGCDARCCVKGNYVGLLRVWTLGCVWAALDRPAPGSGRGWTRYITSVGPFQPHGSVSDFRDSLGASQVMGKAERK